MIENITLKQWQEWFGMKEYRPPPGSAPALPRATADEQEYRWREWAATMALEAAKTKSHWNPHHILILAGGLVELIKHGPAATPFARYESALDDLERTSKVSE